MSRMSHTEMHRRGLGRFDPKSDDGPDARAVFERTRSLRMPQLFRTLKDADPNVKPNVLSAELRQHPVAYSQNTGPTGGGGALEALPAHVAPWPGIPSELPGGCMEEDVFAWHLLHDSDTIIAQTVGGAVFGVHRVPADEYWMCEREAVELLDDWSSSLRSAFDREVVVQLHERRHGKPFGSDAQRWCSAQYRYGLPYNALVRRVWLCGLDPEGRFRLMGEAIPCHLRRAMVEADRRVGIGLGILPTNDDLRYLDGV